MFGKSVFGKVAIGCCALFLSVCQAQAITQEEMVLHQVSKYVSGSEAANIAQDIMEASYKYDVDPILAAAIFTTESHFDNSSRSSVGAIGIAQLMPSTAASLDVNPYNRKENIYGGIKYIGQMVDRYKTWDKPFLYAEAAYNAGPGAVDKFRGIPHYAETQNYVQTVEQTRSEIWKMAGKNAKVHHNWYGQSTSSKKAQEFPSLKEWNEQKKNKNKKNNTYKNKAIKKAQPVKKNYVTAKAKPAAQKAKAPRVVRK